jgi:integrase
MGATFRKRGKRSFLVTVHADGRRQFKTVHSEQDAKALVQYVHTQELAGVNVVETIRQARAARATVTPAPAFPPLREALPAWIDRQTLAGEIRGGTPRAYRSRLTTWFYPSPLPDGRALGDLRADELTREMIGAVIRRVRESGRSLAIIQGIRNPLSGYYRDLIETKQLAGPSPASELRHFIGRRANRKAQQRRRLAFFTQEEGPQLFATTRAGFPRWYAFILTGVLAGLRWGESAALYKDDIDWTHGRLHVQRTFSDKGRVEAQKDGEGRWVSASPALVATLRSHASIEMTAGTYGHCQRAAIIRRRRL